MPDTPAIPALRRYPDLDGKTFLLGVGGMKCATSWVHLYLAGREGVAASPLKELHFFNEKLRPPGHRPFTSHTAQLVRDYLEKAPDIAAEIAVNAQFQAGVDCLAMLYDDNAYFGHFARIAGPETRVLTETTPQYAVLGRDGFAYVRRFFATQAMALKVLFILRDPVERLWSHLRALRHLEPGIDVLRDWPDLIRRRGVIERSDYWQTVEALDAVFPEADVLYLFYEDLVGGEALSRLCAFLGLPYAAPDTTRRNETQEKTALPDPLRARLATLLAPQYRFCRDRFGAAVPASWAL